MLFIFVLFHLLLFLLHAIDSPQSEGKGRKEGTGLSFLNKAGSFFSFTDVSLARDCSESTTTNSDLLRELVGSP